MRAARALQILSLMLAGCSAADPPEAQREAPANTQASEVPGTIGVVPGPCGAEKGRVFLGRRWFRENQSRLQAATGATSMRVMPPAGAPADRRLDSRRLNVLLDDTRRIILLDCG